MSRLERHTDLKVWKNHVVPLIPKDSCPYYTIEYCRHIACHVLFSSTSNDFQLCDICIRESSRNSVNSSATPAKAKAPLSCLTKEKLVATLKDTRVNLKEAKLKCTQLESRIERMQSEINQHGIRLESALEDEFVELVDITSCILIRTFGVSILVPRVVVRCSSCSSCISIYFIH